MAASRDFAGDLVVSDLFEGVNLVPVDVEHRVETLAGVAVTLDVLAGDAGSGGNPSSIVGFGVAAHGTVGLEPLRGDAPAGGGVFRYVPQRGFVGLDYFSYQIGRLDERSPGGWRVETVGWVEVRVRGVNRAPVAAGQLVVIEGDGPVTINVLATASDPDGDRLRLTDLTLPAHGRLELNADQTLTYTPAASFTADDSFGYRIRDIRAEGDGQVGHAEAQVTLRRPPVVAPPNIPPIAGRDGAMTTQGVPITIVILANDIDPDQEPEDGTGPVMTPLRVVGLALPRHGLVALNPDQSITYTPDTGFTGIDDLVYFIEDTRGGTTRGVVMIEVVE